MERIEGQRHCLRGYRPALYALILMTLLLAPNCVEAAAGPEAVPLSSIRLSLPHSITVPGDKEELLVSIDYRGKVAQRAEISITVAGGEGEERLLTEELLLVPGKGQAAIKALWIPGKTGDFSLAARLKLKEPGGWQGPMEVTQRATVNARRLHFSYWRAEPQHRYITETMVNKKADIEYWSDRGVMACRWVNGRSLYGKDKTLTASSMAESWSAPYRQGWPGIVIDEFGSGDQTDQNMGLGLLRAKEMEPRNHIAAYCILVKGEQMAEGLRRSAGRVLMETYTRDARYAYNGIRSRCLSAIENGLADKALAVLAYGGKWATTPQELQRQIHYVRYTFPDMPGLAFYSMPPPEHANKLLRTFYIEPVLRAEIKGRELQVVNIGGRDAPATRIRLRDAEGHIMAKEIDLPPLEAGQAYKAAMPEAFLVADTEFHDGYMILGAPLLWDKEPAEWRPGATDKWPSPDNTAAGIREDFAAEPKLDFEYDKSGKTGFDGNVTAARYPLPASEGRAFQLTFDLHTLRTGFYGSINIGLSDSNGKSNLNLGLGRGDHQPASHFTVSQTDMAGNVSSENLPFGLKEDKLYHIKAYYEPKAYLRVSLSDEGGATLWDTGRIPTAVGISINRLDFSVSSGQGCKIEWDSQRQALLLRGVSSRPVYTTAGYIEKLDFTIYGG